MEFKTIGVAIKEVGVSYLGGVNISAKMVKNQKVNNQLTYVIYLAPAMESGYNMCPNSTPECRLGCLSTSGRAGMEIVSGGSRIKNSRIVKSRLFVEHNEYFMRWMFAEIRKYQSKAKKLGYEFSCRLNGTSDIDWVQYKVDGKNVFETFPEVQFYDYTKNPLKFYNKPENYHLTFSYSGRNKSLALKLLDKGENVAVVFNVKKETELPKSFLGYTVTNGDLTDYRVADNKGTIVGLKWKNIGNRADNETIKKSVFVIQPDNAECSY